MPVSDRILELIDRFDYNLESYKRGQYNETQVRLEYINPLMEELGWDVTNKQGYAEAYKEVIHEDAVKIGGVTKAPDYCFRIGGTRKFFLEAKKPSVNIREDTHPSYQLRRYAWSAKLPLSILTDFEEFAVYDCRVKPVKTDKASNARVMYLKYTDYKDNWDEIAGIFSHDAILKGSFDKYVDSKRKKKGTAEVDTAFLAEIERWRELLARNIALRNPNLSQREVNFSVQRTIDRIIFLRICEDRGVENYGRLMAFQNGERVYKRLFQLFREADARYNSGLFYFQPEKGRPNDIDALTPDLTVDDKVLKDILKNLYYPDSPYEFSVLPSDILGQVYEQFLGKVIRLTPAHRAVIEFKPEVRKAGGVYYTPTYIVDYIVKETVGKLVEGKKPGPRGGVSKLKILDPACGSGSFLLGAYQYLLDWHRDEYVKDNPVKWAKNKNPCLYQKSGDDWRLTTDERKRILLNNIYGVDIDHQAVEVTKLSLLLKVLEGENEETIQRQLSLFQQRALPDLGNNIKCGNSLIGSDFYDLQQINLFDDEEMYRINVFDWEAEFPDIIKSGGFDAVISNPPYIRIQAMKEWAPTGVEFYKTHYDSANKGNYDIYVVFVEKGLDLLNSQGVLGFILPHKFFEAQYGAALRRKVTAGNHLSKIIHFGDQQVFSGATTYTCLLFLDKTGKKEFHYVKAHQLRAWQDGQATDEGKINSAKATAKPWNFVVGRGSDLFEKLEKMPLRLKDVAEKMFQGLVTSSDPVYLLEPVGPNCEELTRVRSKATSKEYLLESEIVPPLCKGSLDIRRYVANPSKRVLFPYDAKSSARLGRTILIPESQLKVAFPNAWAYLKENYEVLRNREKGKMRHEYWYGYVYPKSVSMFGKPKILTPSIAIDPSYTFDRKGELYFVGSGGGGGGGYGITLKEDSEMEYEFLLGLLNSKLLGFFHKKISSPFRGGYYAYSRQYIEQLPICSLDAYGASAKSFHDQIVDLGGCPRIVIFSQIEECEKKYRRYIVDIPRIIF